ncbi:hypothetical protein Cgig2_003342 [Carnegiea gigantea]|uniref:F-box domain-containing protein n=1 Tax=Carnegiea gigantea TaxID=171969 RepID=A0A9Q1K179_9CARY|nr:hypothetical protein Cgig2_003342 [Carnegiea gigantea]
MEDEDLVLDEPVAGESIAGDQCTDDSPMTKWSERTPDRLSELPDLAIVHILSYLYFDEAARTSLLSKRFNSLWNSVTALNFSDESSGKNADRFVNFVDTALGFHHRPEIEKFSLKFRYNLIGSKAVDGWIKVAVKKQVKSLHLNLVQNRKNSPRYEYKLPKFLYSNRKLVELVTSCCKFAKNRRICWNSLKLLSITRTNLNEELISKICSGCPVLETLELKDWSGFDRVKIESASLRVLRIVEEQQPNYLIQPDDECLLEISGCNLMSLEVSGPLYRTKVRLMDLAFEEYSLSPALLEWKNLTLSIPVIKWNHLGIASILHSSPYLETLIIQICCCSDVCCLWPSSTSSNSQNEDYYWSSWATKSRCPLLYLKTIKVVNFHASCGATKLFHFLQFLLRNSRVLEEIIIEASQFVTKEAFDEGMKLPSDSVPKASPDVVVQLEPAHFWVDPLCIYKNSAPFWAN